MDFIDHYISKQNSSEKFRQDNGYDPRRELLQNVERFYLKFTKPDTLGVFSWMAIMATQALDKDFGVG